MLVQTLNGGTGKSSSFVFYLVKPEVKLVLVTLRLAIIDNTPKVQLGLNGGRRMRMVRDGGDDSPWERCRREFERDGWRIVDNGALVDVFLDRTLGVVPQAEDIEQPLPDARLPHEIDPPAGWIEAAATP